MKKFFTFIAAAFVAIAMNAEVMTVAQAYQYGMSLDSAATSVDSVTVEGYVINAGAFSKLYHNQSWYMADDATATESDFQAYNCYPIQGTDTLKVLNGDKVSVTGKLKKYWNKSAGKFIIEFEKANATFIQMAPGDHTVDDVTETATVAQALTIGAALADGGVTEKQYKITAYVSAINVKPSDAWSDQYKNQSFWVADDPNSTASTNADGGFYVYRGKPETEEEIPVGAKVEFTCTIKKYVPSGGGDAVIENADQNIVVKVLEAPAEDTPDVKFEATDFKGLGKAATETEPGGDVLLVKEGVTFHCNNAYGTDTYGVRCYTGGVVTISADTTIGKIVFELYGTYTGGLSPEVVVNDKSWTYTMPSQARMTTISIYFGEAEAPVIDTLTCAAAAAAALDGKTDEVYVLGYVTEIKDPYNDQYHNISFWMADAANGGQVFQAYRAACATEADAPKVGDYVLLKGKLTKFNETPEMAAGCTYEILEAPQGIENIVLTEKAQKVMVDGVVYIVRDNKLFNIQGTQIR